MSATFSVEGNSGTCSPSWFHLKTSDAYSSELFGAGLATPTTIEADVMGVLLTEKAEVELEETGSNQAGCEGAKLVISLHSTP